MIKKVSVLKIADPLFCSKEFKDKVVFSFGQDPEFILSVFNDCYFFWDKVSTSYGPTSGIFVGEVKLERPDGLLSRVFLE